MHIFCSSIVVTVYVLTRRFCGRVLTAGAMTLCMLWLIGLMMPESMMYPALSVLALWTSWLIIPVSDERLQRRRALGAGFLAAMMFLFRYDKGVGIVAANLIAVAVMRWMQPREVRRSPKRLMATVIGPYLTAFSIIVIPAAIAYLSVAPIYDLLYDVVIYMAKYYRAGRGQPLPKLQLGADVSRRRRLSVADYPCAGILVGWPVGGQAEEEQTSTNQWPKRRNG